VPRPTIEYDARRAADYARLRGLSREVLDELLRGGAVGPGDRVLEVGCGTGNYIAAIQEITGATSFGIDISEPMLAHARARARTVVYAWGVAESLEFEDARFDFVYSVDVAHHLYAPEAYIAEAARVLKPGGRLATMTKTPEMIRALPVLARYFPEIVEIELARYPSIAGLTAAMEAAGFGAIRTVEVEVPYEVHDIAVYACKGLSALQLIPEEAFARGLAALERDLAKGPVAGPIRHLFVWGRR